MFDHCHTTSRCLSNVINFTQNLTCHIYEILWLESYMYRQIKWLIYLTFTSAYCLIQQETPSHLSLTWFPLVGRGNNYHSTFYSVVEEDSSDHGLVCSVLKDLEKFFHCWWGKASWHSISYSESFIVYLLSHLNLLL